MSSKKESLVEAYLKLYDEFCKLDDKAQELFGNSIQKINKKMDLLEDKMSELLNKMNTDEIQYIFGFVDGKDKSEEYCRGFLEGMSDRKTQC